MKNGHTVQYGSRNSILLVNSLGRIRELYTPFRVRVIDPTDDLTEGSFVYVEEVASTEEGKLAFITATGIWDHSRFRIIASF